MHAGLCEQRAQRRRLDRLVEQLDALCACFLAHRGAAIGGDQNRGRAREAAAQLRNGLDAVLLAEMLVDEHCIWRTFALDERGQRRRQVCRLDDAAAPAAEQHLHAVKDGRLVVDAQHT